MTKLQGLGLYCLWGTSWEDHALRCLGGSLPLKWSPERSLASLAASSENVMTHVISRQHTTLAKDKRDRILS